MAIQDQFSTFFKKRIEDAKTNIAKANDFRQKFIVNPIDEINELWLADMTKKKLEEEKRKKQIEESQRKLREFEQKNFQPQTSGESAKLKSKPPTPAPVAKPTPSIVPPTPVSTPTLAAPVLPVVKNVPSVAKLPTPVISPDLFQSPQTSGQSAQLETDQAKIAVAPKFTPGGAKKQFFTELSQGFADLGKVIPEVNLPSVGNIFSDQEFNRQMTNFVLSIPHKMLVGEGSYEETSKKLAEGNKLGIWDALNISDFIPISLATKPLKLGVKQLIKGTTEQVVEEIAQKTTKIAAERIAKETGEQLTEDGMKQLLEETRTKLFGVADTAYESVIKNGGVTINLAGNVPTRGFAYAPFKGTEYVKPVKEFTEADIIKFFDKNYDKISKKGKYLGGWVSEGNVYLDISEVGEASAKTLEKAQRGKQLAVFDLENFKDVNLGTMENGVYNKLDEATNVFDKYRREIEGATSQGGMGSVPEVLGLGEGSLHSSIGKGAAEQAAESGVKATGGEVAAKVTKGVLEDIQQGFEAARKIEQTKTPVLNKVRTELLDRLSPVFDFVKKAGGELPAEVNPYKKMRLYSGISGRIEQVLEDGLVPILRKEAKRLPDLSSLLVLDRDMERLDRGIASRYTVEQIQEGMAALRNKYGAEGFQTLMDSAQKVRDFANTLLDELHSAGIVGDDAFKAIKTNNEMYVPFEVIEHMSDSLESGKFATGSFNTASQNVIKGLKGSSSQVADPIEALVRRTGKILSLVERNKTMQSLIDLRVSHPEVYSDLIVPIRTADDVLEKIKLFGEAKELRPVRNKALRMIKTRFGWAKHIQSELNVLNKEGLTKYLKRPSAPSGEISTKALADFSGYLKKSQQEAKNIIESLITAEPQKLLAIKKKIAFRDTKLAETMDEILRLNSEYLGAKNKIMDLMDKADALKTAKESGTEVISLFNKGVQEQYRVPEEVAMAIKNLDVQNSNVLIQLLSVQAKVLRAGSTAFNMAFIPVNIIRDFQNAVLGEYTEGGAKAVGQLLFSFPHAIATAMTKGKTYQKWLKAGGSQSTMTEALFKKTPETIKELAGQKSVMKRIISSPKDLIEFVNRVGEQSTRIARFESGLARGESAAEAAFRARDITVDFAKSGNTIKLLNQVVPFLNANIQGTEKMARMWKTNPKRAMVGTTVMAGLPTTLLYLNNRRFKDYNDIPQYEKKDNYFIILRDRTPEEVAAGDKIIGIKIPKGQMLKPAANITENFLQFADNEDPQPWDELAIDTVEDISPVGLPVDKKRIGRTLSTVSAPVLEAGIQYATGQNLYTGMPIVPRKMQGTSPELQFDEDTPEAAKWIGKATGQSPMMIEDITTTLTGAVGRQALKVASGDIKGATAGEIVRRFSPIAGGAQQEKQYDELNKYITKGKDESLTRSRDAEKIYAEMKGMDSKEYAARAVKIISTDKLLWDKIKEIKKDDIMGIDSFDRSIKALPVEQRSEYLLDKMNQIGNKEANRQFVLDLIRKKIATPDVMKQLIKYRSQGMVEF